ncbi:MAG: type II secretion system protein [Filifactoraceae bacterium]
MKSRKGFTLMEVVMSFLIVSILFFLVMATLTGMGMQLKKERERTVFAFNEQGELEEKIAKVEKLISEKLKQEEILNASGSLEPDIKKDTEEKLEKIKAELSAYNSFIETVNNVDIKIYEVNVDHKNSEGVKIGKLSAWVLDRKELSFSMPEVDSIKIKFFDEPDNNIPKYGFNRVGKSMSSDVKYGKNKDKLFTEQYVWYSSRPGFHMIEPSSEKFKAEELLIGKVYPVFSRSYEYISEDGSSAQSEKEKTLSEVKDNMKGRFIILGLRPTIREGKIGVESKSNSYYIANYPKNPIGALDSSLISDFPDNRKFEEVIGIDEKIYLKEIPLYNIPEIIVHGDKTGKIKYKGSEYDTYSRFFKFDSSSAYGIDLKDNLPNKYTIYIVCKEWGNASTIPIVRGKGIIGGRDSEFDFGFDKFNYRFKEDDGSFNNYISIGTGTKNENWNVMALSFSGSQVDIYKNLEKIESINLPANHFSKSFDSNNEFILGNGAEIDVAEVIIGKETGKNDVEEMITSLMNKYGLIQ